MSHAELPETSQLRLEQRGWVLHVTLDRPEVRNAMSFHMVDELERVFDALEGRRDIRAIVLRGAGGHFCAGGDVKDMAGVRGAKPGPDGKDPMAVANRRFGTMLQRLDAAPQAVIAVTEGAVMGGGFGLCCISDAAIAIQGSRFRLPETGLGITPAQIAPFIVRRLGLTQARLLAVTGRELDATRAATLGLVHYAVPDEAAAMRVLDELLADIQRAAPGANALTKRLIVDAAEARHEDLGAVLDRAAEEFAAAARSPEAVEGMTAFLQKRRPSWAQLDTAEEEAS